MHTIAWYYSQAHYRRTANVNLGKELAAKPFHVPGLSGYFRAQLFKNFG